MKKKSKKAGKGIGKAVRKAVKRHSIATGVLTGAVTAVALSTSGATRKMSEAVGSGVAGFLKAGNKRDEILSNLKTKTGAALVRAGRSLQPKTEMPTTDAKVTTTTRRSAAPKPTA